MMKIYLDDNKADAALARSLRKAGHLVVRPAEVGLTGVSDPRHFQHAIQAGLTVLTGDREDFHELHDLVLTSGGSHSGILIIRSDNDPKRDMKTRHILVALQRLERSGVPLESQLLVLNHWR
jgi:predicted nuclease of predicted toxin-antitoxin system